MIALSGGPGQGSVDAAGSFALSLEPVLKRYRLVVLDQRGTGLSGALNCPSLQRLGGLEEFSSQAVAQCAKRIGSRRAFYRTADTVDDLEALRKALGVPKIGLMGISYGTWVAQEYARRYPTHTDSLILDSIVGPDPPDAFAMSNFETLPRILREECASDRCKGATSDIVGDVGKVAAKLARGPLRGHGVRRSRAAAAEQLHDAEPVLLPRHLRRPEPVHAGAPARRRRVRGARRPRPAAAAQAHRRGPADEDERAELRPERHDELPRRAAAVLRWPRTRPRAHRS